MTKPPLPDALKLQARYDKLVARADAVIGMTRVAYVQAKLFEFDKHLDDMANCLTENIHMQQAILNDIRGVLLLRKGGTR